MDPVDAPMEPVDRRPVAVVLPVVPRVLPVPEVLAVVAVVPTVPIVPVVDVDATAEVMLPPLVDALAVPWVPPMVSTPVEAALVPGPVALMLAVLEPWVDRPPVELDVLDAVPLVNGKGPKVVADEELLDVGPAPPAQARSIEEAIAPQMSLAACMDVSP